MKKRGLMERLDAGPVICAEGFLFEVEKEVILLPVSLFLWFH